MGKIGGPNIRILTPEARAVATESMTGDGEAIIVNNRQRGYRARIEEALRKIFEELEFRTLMERIFKKESSPASPIAGTLFNQENGPVQGNLFEEFTPDHTNEEKKSNLESLNSLSYDYQLIDTEEKRNEIIKKLLTSEILALDTETTGTDPMDAELVGMSFSITENQAFYVPVPAEREEAIKIVREFEPVFKNEKSLKVGQNIKYDMLVLQNYGIEVRGKLFDTMVAHYMLKPDLRHGMDYLSETYLGYRPVSIETLIGPKGRSQRSMRDADVAAVKEYSAEDADVTWQLHELFTPMLEQDEVTKLFEEVEMPLISVLADMENEGIRIDIPALKAFSEELGTDLLRLQEEIHAASGVHFNIDSPKQLGDVLFETLKLGGDRPKKTRTGQYQTSEDILQTLNGTHPVIPLILDYRSLRKLKGTYVDTLPEAADQHTGRVHTNYLQTVAATGRLASNDPNLQNIPIRTEKGREMLVIGAGTFKERRVACLRDPRGVAPVMAVAAAEPVQTATLVDVPLPRPRPAGPGETQVTRPVNQGPAETELRLVQFGDKVVRVVGPDTPYAQPTPAGT